MADINKNSTFEDELELLQLRILKITHTLHVLKNFILLLIFVTIFGMVFTVFKYSVYKNLLYKNYTIYNYSDFQIATYITIIMSFLGIVLLYFFHSYRKDGMNLYDELTDELEWGSRRKEFLRNFPKRIRSVIKNFIQQADLPFTSGQNGQSIYLIFFMIIIAAQVYLIINLNSLIF